MPLAAPTARSMSVVGLTSLGLGLEESAAAAALASAEAAVAAAASGGIAEWPPFPFRLSLSEAYPFSAVATAATGTLSSGGRPAGRTTPPSSRAKAS